MSNTKDSPQSPSRLRHSRGRTLTRSDELKPILEAVFVCLGLACLLFILRAPTARLGLVYYDDGETLYHTLSFLAGKVPYRDDYSHHFLGYVLPFVVAAKVFGFSLDLIREVAFFTQLFTSLGVFLSMRMLVDFRSSAIAAGVTLALHQPAVWGFYQQYEINLFTAFIFYYSLRYCVDCRLGFLKAAALLCGVAFTFDQRALLLIFIPISALLLARKDQPVKLGALLLLWFCLPSGLALIYLMQNEALAHCLQQTIIFPFKYRAASLNLVEIFKTWFFIHIDLIRDCTIACVTGFVGFAALTRTQSVREGAPANGEEQMRTQKLLMVSAVPMALMPIFGARNFPYYVVSWYPYIGMLSAFSGRFFLHIHPQVRRLLTLAPTLAIVLPLALACMALKDHKDSVYTGDGRAEVVRFLKSHMSAEDTVYVWAYRMDVYAELGRLAAYPFANRIMIHPDHLIVSPTDRTLHVYPEYEERFLKLLEAAPPTFIVTFDRNNLGSAPSRANDRVSEMLVTNYQPVYEIEKTDFLNARTKFEVFRIRDRNVK